MLKAFYKLFLVAILSGSLMLMDFSFKGAFIQSARAESVKTDAVKDGNLMATLSMTAIGVLASRLWTCKMTTDMMIAAAGGAAFIAGEILAALKLRSVMKDMETKIERDKAGNINREQIAALERLKQSYEEAKETANTKKMLQQAAAAAFAAAAVASYMMVAQEVAAKAACDASIKTAGMCQGLQGQTTANMSMLGNLFYTRVAPAPSNTGMATQIGNEAGEKAAESTTTMSAKALAAKYKATCKLPKCAGCWACPLIGPCEVAGAVVSPGCAGVTPTLKMTTGFCPAVPGIVSNLRPEMRTYANRFDNPHIAIATLLTRFLTPSNASADMFSAMGIASTAAINYLLAVSKTLGATIDSFMLAPKNRAIAWGIMAGLTYAASSATDNVIAQIDSNIMKIDIILNSMYSLDDGTTGTQVSQRIPRVNVTTKPGPALNFEKMEYEDVDLKGAGGTLPCFTGDDPKNCKSFDSVAKDLPSFQSLDKEAQKQIGDILKTTSSFQGTSKISKGSLESAAKLASSASALKAKMDGARAKEIEATKKNGEKFNFDQQTKKFSDAVESSVRGALKKSNSTPSQMLASIYGGRGSVMSSATNVGSEDKTKEEGSVNAAVAPVAVIDLSAPGGGEAPKVEELDLAGTPGDVTQMSEAEVAAYNEATKGIATTNMDDFEIKNQEINSTKTSTIFEVISNRYQRSGYKRLFNKVKEVPETPVKN